MNVKTTLILLFLVAHNLLANLKKCQLQPNKPSLILVKFIINV